MRAVPYVATRNPLTALESGHSWGQPYWKLPVVHIRVAKYTLNSPCNRGGGASRAEGLMRTNGDIARLWGTSSESGIIRPRPRCLTIVRNLRLEFISAYLEGILGNL